MLSGREDIEMQGTEYCSSSPLSGRVNNPVAVIFGGEGQRSSNRDVPPLGGATPGQGSSSCSTGKGCTFTPVTGNKGSRHFPSPLESGHPSTSSQGSSPSSLTNRHALSQQSNLPYCSGGNRLALREGSRDSANASSTAGHFSTPKPTTPQCAPTTSFSSSLKPSGPRGSSSSSLSVPRRLSTPPVCMPTTLTKGSTGYSAAVHGPLVSPITSSSSLPSHHNTNGPSASTPAVGDDREDGTEEEEEENMEEGDVQSTGGRACLDSSSDENVVFLSVVWYGGKLGLAYYDADTMLIHVMLDGLETDDFFLLKMAIRQLQPSRIVLSSKQDERLMKMLKEETGSGSGSDQEDGASHTLQCLPNSDFSLELSRQRILSMNLPSVPDHFTETERMLHFSSLLPLDNVSMVKALGGLLKFLEKMRVGVELEDASVRVPLLGIRIFSLDDHMIVDDTAYSALQIFQKESHPSAFKAGTSNSLKEGLSLYGIINRCKSGVGSKKLRLWFLRPLKSIRQIRERQDAVAFFLQPRNLEMISCLQNCLRFVKNVPKILGRMVQTQVGRADWHSLFKTASHSIEIREFCRRQQQPLTLFRKISEAFTDDLFKLASLISEIVDLEELSMAREFVVRPGVNAELDHKKRVYHGLPDLMTKVAREELDTLNNEITECSVTYLPQLGYLLAAPDTEELARKKYQLPGMDFVFLSNKMCHFKTASMKELDVMVGDIQVEITDQETVILHRLQKAVLEHTDLFLHVVDYAAELDCILSLAVCAREFNYVKPELVNEDVLDIKGGRHPLQELCCSPFVPNNAHSSSRSQTGKIKILTGPNASGKSVYLKQVALIVFLAQIGSYVPAESAVVGMVDRIFTRIKSLESVSVGLSTFMLDINQMSEALQRSTKRSLVLVDEFGKGTEAVDGLALLCSCLHYWVRQGRDCPHVLVCTHFHSIVTQRMLPRSPIISYLTMETVLDGQDLVFLYQLKRGHTSSSYASHIALQAGLPREVVDRGTKVSGQIRLGQPIERIDTSTSVSHLQRCEKVVERFLELDLDKGDVEGFLEEVKAMST